MALATVLPWYRFWNLANISPDLATLVLDLATVFLDLVSFFAKLQDRYQVKVIQSVFKRPFRILVPRVAGEPGPYLEGLGCGRCAGVDLEWRACLH